MGSRVRYQAGAWVTAGYLAAAAAALADTHLGTRGGVTYIQDHASPSPPTVSVIEAECPAPKEASGGLANPGTSVTASDLNDVAPADGGDDDANADDAWFASVNFPDTPFFPNPEVFAICEATSHRHPTASVMVSAGAAGSVKVSCPSDTKPTGGGATLSGDEEDGAYVNSSYPFDGPDANRKPDDGWKARAYNPAGTEKTLAVTAVCRRGDLRYKRFSDYARPGRFGFASAGCKVIGTQHLLGNGWRWTGAAAGAELVDDFLNDSFDSDDVPDDYATIAGENLGGARKKLTGYAVCTP